jgi:perosamine synthetase
VLSTESGFDARQFADLLASAYIGTRPFFYPIHLQPLFQSQGLFHNVSLPVSERLALQGLYLPSGLALKDNHIDRVCDIVISLL